MDFPWKENGTLVRQISASASGDESGEILFEGTLLAMVRKVRAIDRNDRKGLRISMPDRHVRPYSFQGEALSSLVENMPLA
ncbi:MAG TPA: hypothetical protein VNJ10_04700 [Sphingomonas sp.]|nr:hypothetical protein [Sphingomonas sp.]